jgi:hypothetical protein
MAMVTKSIRIEEEIVDKMEKVANGLNQQAGVNVYDFSNVVRLAFNQFLSTNEIKELITLVKEKEANYKADLLSASESSLGKVWLKQEEDEAWADL